MNEYWIVKEKTTGKVVAHCGDINDAMMLVSFNPNNRTYSRYRVLVDQVIDVTSTTDKQLPGQIGLPSSKVNSLKSHKIQLPENQQEPVTI